MGKHFNDKFKIPKIIRTINLADYAAEFGEAVIEVWVNPPRDLLVAIAKIQGEVQRLVMPAPDPAPAEGKASTLTSPGGMEAAGSEGPLQSAQADLGDKINKLTQETFAWYAEIWSQGKAENHWTVEEIQTLVKNAKDTDPKLWAWICNKTGELIGEHRSNAKKG
jgi:hypothetical protein